MKYSEQNNLNKKNFYAPVMTIAVLVLIWVTASVLLTISVLTQRDFTVLKKGDSAPFSTWALTDFSYIDREKTLHDREEARNKAPVYYKVSSEKSERLQADIESFFRYVPYRMQNNDTDNNDLAKAVENFKNFSELSALVKKRELLQFFKQELYRTIRHGINGNTVSGRKIIVTDEHGRRFDNFLPPSPEEAVTRVMNSIPGSSEFKNELISALVNIISHGNLVYDRVSSNKVREAAANAVEPSRKYCQRGDLIVVQGGIITDDVIDKIRAEKDALPQNFGMALFYHSLAVSFLLLLVGFIFLYNTYTGFFSTPYLVTLAGMSVILSLLINYSTIALFFELFQNGKISNYQLLFAMLPIPLCAALSTAFLGNRGAIFCVFLVSSISAMMAFPDRSFEQMLRWFFTGLLVILAVRNVRNYRSFFIRVFAFGTLSIALINSDLFIYSGSRVLLDALTVILTNSFACAVASLLLVFIFEIVFNADTNMSLMMLCDHSHRLLDELKRRAPGTMFHSMNVATLAEDAATAIHANPMRAKAGALFHDIGKLSNPHYFVENNVDSPAEHEKLPPRQSCSIIREHVSDGLFLARKHRLSRFLRSAIETHHGNDLVSFFYQKAVEFHNNNPSSPVVSEADYRYTGTPPEGKELTIISLADACEAACRSLKNPSEESIREMVEKIFIHRLQKSQLSLSKLTLKELNTVKECFITDLVNFNHGRIAYNKEKNDDPAEQQVVLPEQTGTSEE